MGFSLRRLVVLGSLLVAMGSLAVVGLLSYQGGRARLENETGRHLKQLSGSATALAVSLAQAPATSAEDAHLSTERIVNALISSLSPSGYRVSIIDSQGRLLADSGLSAEDVAQAENHLKRPEVAQAPADGPGYFKRFSASEGQEYLFVAQAFNLPNGDRLILRLGRPFKEVIAEQNQFLQHYVVAFLAALALAITLSLLLGRLFFNPLSEIITASRALAQGDLGYRIRHYPANELAEIGRTFDRMAGRLEQQIALTAQSRDYLQAVLEAASEGILVTDHRGRVTLANPAFMGLFGLTENPESLLPAEVVRASDFIAAFQKADQGKKVSGELITLREPAKILEVTINPIILADSEFSGGLVAIFHDLTSRQKLYQMRRDFVANFSHELKTPLTALMTAAETLQSRPPSDPRLLNDLLDIIDRQSRRLNDLTQGLLRLATLESPPQDNLACPFTLFDFIARIETQAADRARLAAPTPGNLLINRPPNDVGMAGDQETLVMAVVNLIDNAFKYGPSDQIVTVSFTVEDENIVIEVADQGPGIPPEAKERIFERFYRLEKSRGRSGGGAGLGLALVKHAVRRHQGAVTVRPGLKGGAVFQIKLPRC